MLASMLSPRSGRRTVVAVGLAAVSITLAACDDAATAPKASRADSSRSPNAMLVGVGGTPSAAATLTIRVVDIYGNNLKEAMPIHFVSYPGPLDYADVTDNGAGDLDPTLGIVKVQLEKGTAYEACEMGGTLSYLWDPNNPTYPRCRYLETSAFNVDMGKVYARKKPVVTWYTKDEFGNLIWPATLQVTIGNWSKPITDGDGIMDGGLNGNISIKVQGENNVSWCETKAPFKYAAITNKCGTIVAKFDQTYTYTIKHEQLIY